MYTFTKQYYETLLQALRESNFAVSAAEFEHGIIKIAANGKAQFGHLKDGTPILREVDMIYFRADDGYVNHRLWVYDVECTSFTTDDQVIRRVEFPTLKNIKLELTEKGMREFFRHNL